LCSDLLVPKGNLNGGFAADNIRAPLSFATPDNFKETLLLIGYVNWFHSWIYNLTVDLLWIYNVNIIANQAMPWSGVLEKLTVTEPSRNSALSVERKLSLPCSQEPATGPYPEPYESRYPILFPYDLHLYIGLPSGFLMKM
jgi:hypothetical protein